MFYKAELNMKDAGIKKKHPNTHNPLLKPEIFYKVKKLVSLMTVVCLPLSHSSLKVRIRLSSLSLHTSLCLRTREHLMDMTEFTLQAQNTPDTGYTILLYFLETRNRIILVIQGMLVLF